MNAQWNNQTFATLRDFSQELENRHSLNPLTQEEAALKARYEEILCFIESNRIWPFVASPARRKFESALCDVLSRLPEDDFNRINDVVGFVLEDPSIEPLAMNVPAPPGINGKKLGVDNIVFFKTCLSFETDALIGLIAHEICHSLVSGDDYSQDEATVNAKVRKWGFGNQLDCLEREKLKLRQTQ